MSIYSCIEHGSVEEVRSCFQEHAGAFDIVPPLPYKKLPVHLAIRHGRTDLIEVLHDINEKWIDLVSMESETPLSLAARYGNLAAVKILIKLGCSQHMPDRQSKYPLIHAITAGNNDMIRELVAWNPCQLECGADLLNVTISYGHLSTIELLVELVGLDKLIDSTYDPLASAVYRSQLHCLPLLFRLGFSVNHPRGNINAIWYSTRMADTTTLEYLVNQGGRGQETEIPLPMPYKQHGSETIITLVRLGFRCFKKSNIRTNNNELTLRTLFALLPEYLHYYEGNNKDHYHRCLEDEDFSAHTRNAAYFTEPLVVRCLRENSRRHFKISPPQQKIN